MSKKSDKKDSPIVRTATYTIQYHEKKDGTTSIHRVADGFSAIELLGILALTNAEIIEQMKGTIRPDEIKREVVK